MTSGKLTDSFPCPKCGKAVASDNKFCWNCGESLYQSNIASTIKNCESCGGEISGYMAYCPHCRAKLEFPKPKTHDSKAKSKLKESNTSGQGSQAIIPPEIRGWNWGAFLLWWIWGIGNNTYISFLTIIPCFGQIIMPFILGTRGSEWAWRNKAWDGTKHFKYTQKEWATAGFIVAILSLAIPALWFGYHWLSSVVIL